MPQQELPEAPAEMQVPVPKWAREKHEVTEPSPVQTSVSHQQEQSAGAISRSHQQEQKAGAIGRSHQQEPSAKAISQSH